MYTASLPIPSPSHQQDAMQHSHVRGIVVDMPGINGVHFLFQTAALSYNVGVAILQAQRVARSDNFFTDKSDAVRARCFMASDIGKWDLGTLTR